MPDATASALGSYVRDPSNASFAALLSGLRGAGDDDVDKAISCLWDLATHRPTELARLHLSILLVNRRRFAEAEYYLGLILHSQPRNIEAWSQLNWVAACRGDVHLSGHCVDRLKEFGAEGEVLGCALTANALVRGQHADARQAAKRLSRRMSRGASAQAVFETALRAADPELMAAVANSGFSGLILSGLSGRVSAQVRHLLLTGLRNQLAKYATKTRSTP